MEKHIKIEKKIWWVFQKVSDQQRKNVREIWKKLRHFLEKLQRFSRNLRRFFWNVGDIIPIWKAWLREARCEGCESKKSKIPGKARASHAREEKSLWRGAKWNKSDLPFHPTKFGRKYAIHRLKSAKFAKWTKQFHLHTKKKLHFFGDFYLFASFGTHIV